MRLGKRVIREEPLAATRIVNCPLYPVGEFYCHARCPMRVGGHCVCKIVAVAMKCEENCDKESGRQAYLWSFECVHCSGEALIVTPDKSLVGSQGFCLACGARYLYHHMVETPGEDTCYYLAVSRRHRLNREKAEK